MSMPDMPALDYVVAQNNSALAPSAVAFSQCQFNMVLCSNIRWGGWLGRHVDWWVGLGEWGYAGGVRRGGGGLGGWG